MCASSEQKPVQWPVLSTSFLFFVFFPFEMVIAMKRELVDQRRIIGFDVEKNAFLNFLKMLKERTERLDVEPVLVNV